MRLVAGDRNDLRWQRAQVWLDDIDVTRRCTMADDERGEVELFVADDAGRHMVTGDALAKEVLTGRVRIHVAEAHV